MNIFNSSLKYLLIGLLVVAAFSAAYALATPKDQAQIEAGSVYSVSDKKGRFHRIHTKILKLDCEQCHGGERYQDDHLLVSKHSEWLKRKMGRIEQSSCLGCHMAGGMGAAFYQGTTRD